MTGLFCRRTPARRQEDMPMAKRKKIRANRQYKDTVFRMLFSDKKICYLCIMRLTEPVTQIWSSLRL